jgi:O-succinylbenzoic acid--CoA ligase
VRGTAEQILDLLRAWEVADDPAPLSVETSGSTGRPKRVLLSRKAMRASADATLARLGGPGQWVLNLPPAYVAGLQVLFRSVRAGTEPVLHHDDLATAAQRLTAERRYVSLVPTQLHGVLDDPTQTTALARFDAVLVGGASLDPHLRATAEAAGIRIVTTYGMSETCGGCVYDGLPLDGVAVKIGADERIRIGGPVLFDGYDTEDATEDATEEATEDGWFVTQDRGRIDDDGYLQVLGRVDDVVISGGVNVPTAAVASRLRAHADVRAVEVLGVPDDRWGQRVVAVVVGTLELGDARDWVAEQHPRAWAPREIVHVDALPLLGNGKVDRLALAGLARA